MRKLISAFDTIILFLTLIIAVIFGFFTSMPELGKIVTWIGSLLGGSPSQPEPKDIQSLTIPLVALISITLLRQKYAISDDFERTNAKLSDLKFDIEREIVNSANALMSSMQGSEIKIFESEKDLKKYLSRRISQAKSSIWDLIWAHRSTAHYIQLRSNEQMSDWEKQEAEFENAVKNVSRAIEYREIFVLSRKDRLEKLKARLADKAPRYLARVHKDLPIPRLQFVLIDGTEAIFVSDNYTRSCAVVNQVLVNILSGYFEDAWATAESLVEISGNTAKWNVEKTNLLIEEAERNLTRD